MRRTENLRTACLLTAVVLTAAAPTQKTTRVGHSRHIFVQVNDPRGAPILDLGPNDFEVTESARKRIILAAGLAKSPMRVALFVDTSDGTANAINQIRNGLGSFLEGLPPTAEVLIVTTGRQVRVRLQPTADHQKAVDLVRGLFSDGGATPLRDAILEIDDRFFRKAEDRWPVFVIVTGDSAESSAPANETRFNKWLNDMPARGIAAHAFALKYRGGGIPDLVAQHVVQTAGGRFDYMNTANGLPDKLKALGSQLGHDADEMTRWYDVEFETTTDASTPAEVGVSRQGVTIKVSNRRLQP